MSRNYHNPISWIPTVYFAMGLPFVVLNMVSVLMFKGLGVGDAQIALWTSLIMLPWTLKFLWSPFLEMFKTKKFFVVLTQLVTGAGFALVAFALNLPFFFALSIFLLAVIAFSGATHDVATDGVYMSELNKQEQAKYIGWQGAFYNIAKIVASGGLVWLAGWLLKYFGGVPGATDAVEVSLESFSRDVQDEEILRGADAVGYGSGVRTGRLCTESSVLFCSFHFFAGGYRFQRRYARCGNGRRVHVRAE